MRMIAEDPIAGMARFHIFSWWTTKSLLNNARHVPKILLTSIGWNETFERMWERKRAWVVY